MKDRETLFEPYCGAGGMGSGFARYFQISYAVDVLPEAVATYSANFPGADVQIRDVHALSGVRGDFDGIAGVIGGPPCQSWSIINVKRGVGVDPRRELCQEFMRLVTEIRPRFFVLENVPFVPKQVKETCRKIGLDNHYTCKTEYLDASHYGAAQTRKRWLLIGLRNGTIREPRKTQSKTVRDAFQGLHKNWGMMQSRPDMLARLSGVKSCEWVPISQGGFRNACRLNWDRPSPTIVNLKKVYMVHPDENRNISLAEAAALQGFHPDFTWKGTESKIAQMIANAMPIELAEAIAESLSLDERRMAT